jgi:hypothetical protein
MNNLDLLSILTSYRDKIVNMSNGDRAQLYLQISENPGVEPEVQSLAQIILEELANYLLPAKGGSGLFHDAEYYVYEARWKGDRVAVSPAYGYKLAWGDSPDDEWTYSPEKFVTLYYPGEGK